MNLDFFRESPIVSKACAEKMACAKQCRGWICGAIIGMLAGAAVGMALAPKAGGEMIKDIKNTMFKKKQKDENSSCAV